jgi:hypothetical protein
MTVTEEDFAKLLAELSHLRRQRDELQAHNTRLEERARAAETKLRELVEVVVLASGERLSSTIDKQAMCSALEAEADAIEASP